MNDIASMLVLAAQNLSTCMTAIEDGDIDAPEEVYFGFGEQQDRLNTIIQSRVPLRAAVDTGSEIAERLVALVIELENLPKRPLKAPKNRTLRALVPLTRERDQASVA